MLRWLIMLAALCASPVAAQTLTLGNLKAPIAKAAGKPPAKSIVELWTQINSLPVTATSSVPTTAELMPVASGLNVASLLQPAWGHGGIPGPEQPKIEGAFRFLCGPSHLSYDDALLYPNQPGKSHLHQYFGNTKADAFSTYASLRTTGDSTCNNALNRSAYWIPGMMHPSGKVVIPDFGSVYYKRPPSDSEVCSTAPNIVTKACKRIPRGLRYIFGYNMQGGKHDPADMRWFNCDGQGAIGGHFATIADAARGCPAGARIGAVIVGPNCWNGTELDSADHRSHMAYTQDNGNGVRVCPSTHPYLIAFFELAAWYTNDGTAAQWKLSSDMGLAGGTTLHADWFGAWEDSILDLWQDKCIDGALSCSGGDLGNGTQLKTLAGYRYGNTTVLADLPAR